MALRFWLPLNKVNTNNRGLGGTSTPSFSTLSLTSEPSPNGHDCSTGRAVFAMQEDEFDNEFTIALWANYTAEYSTAGNTIISCKNKDNDTTATHWYFSVYGGNRLAIGINGAAATYKHEYTFVQNTWYHLAATYNGTAYRLFVNGTLVGSGTCTNAKQAGCKNIGIGCRSTNTDGTTASGGDAWKMSDVRIYDNALSDGEILDLFVGKVFEMVPQWIDADNVFDATGFIFPLTTHSLTVSGNKAIFNGSSTYIDFQRLHLSSGGTVSVWFSIPSKPTAQRYLYYDPVSKMSIQFSTDGNIHLGGDGTSQSRYSVTGITWGQLTNVIGVWNSSCKPSAIYINGVKPSTTGKATSWTTGGTVAAIGRRIGGGSADYLNGEVNSVQVFKKQFTAAEAQKLYNVGPVTNNWDDERPEISSPIGMRYSGCTWLKVLHHDAPSMRLFTSSNGKNSDDENLYSKLGLFDSNTNFRMANLKYEFMVREKLESTSVENEATWVQTSNPTASTATGFQKITPSTDLPRGFALTHQSSNAVFDDSGNTTWWCACGCNTAHQGGIPGFWGVVKTGYLDLYIRIDDTKYMGAAMVPNEYTPLQYIEANGTQWIDTNLSGFDTDDWEIFCEWKLSSAPATNYANVFSVYEAEENNAYRLITNQKSTTDYYANGNTKAAGGSISVTGRSSASTHTIILSGNGKFIVDGTSYNGSTFGTSLPAGNTMGLFRTKTSSGTLTSPFKGRICAFWAKKSGILKSNIVPVKRKSDNVVGAYDVIRKMFLPNSGTGSFTAGPTVSVN